MNAVKRLTKDPVLLASWVLALISAFFVRPDAEYLSYIDFRSLGILWSLMIIMEVCKCCGLFGYIGGRILNRTNNICQVVLVLIFLCFFSSMLITNDVALITFVPFACMILMNCKKEKLLIPVIVLQTVAANLGSMLTPVGNPQNLYLYGLSGMGILDFLRLMLPGTVTAGLMLLISVFLLPGKREAVENTEEETPVSGGILLPLYGALFVLALLTVLRVVDYYVLASAVLIVTLIFSRKTLLKADYALLFTFVGFFIFTGNMGRIPLVADGLKRIVDGHEMISGVMVSQVISNVPAALLLSGFTGNIPDLILGVNYGGLGTLIASMASLISYKYYANTKNAEKGKYLLCFTAVNAIFLVVLLLFHTLIR